MFFYWSRQNFQGNLIQIYGSANSDSSDSQESRDICGRSEGSKLGSQFGIIMIYLFCSTRII